MAEHFTLTWDAQQFAAIVSILSQGDMDAARKLDAILALLRVQGQRIDQIEQQVLELLQLLPKKPVAMRLDFGRPQNSPTVTITKENSTMSTPPVPGQETDKQTIPCSALETDADGNPVALNPANVTWAIDKLPDGTDLATLTQNADGSATFKAVQVGGPVNVSCTDNAQTPPLVGTNTLTVVKSVATPTKMALVFGDPQASTN